MEFNIPGLEQLAKKLSEDIDDLDDKHPDQKKHKDVLTQILAQVLNGLRMLKKP